MLELVGACSLSTDVCCIEDPSKVISGAPSDDAFEFKNPHSRSVTELPRLIGSVMSVAWDGGAPENETPIDTLELVGVGVPTVELGEIDLRTGSYRFAFL